jgi:hypothetical protein
LRHLYHFAFCASLTACNTLVGVSEGTPRPEGESAGDPSAGCTNNAECVERTGEFDPSACVDGACVKLFTPECPFLLPQTDRAWLANLRASEPDPVIFGVFAIIPGWVYGTSARNYDLALIEINRAVGGLPSAGGNRRPIVALVCNAKADQARFDVAIDHLIDELKVPGILAGLETTDLIHAFERRGRDRHVFFLSPVSAEKSLVELDDGGLVWNMLPGGAAVAQVYRPLLDLTLEHLRKTGALAEEEEARVAVVRADNVAHLAETATALTELIEFNGESAEANAPDHFRAFSISSPVVGEVDEDYSTVIRELIDFSPHVIISATANEFPDAIMPALELENPKTRPFYLLSTWNYHDGTLFDLASTFKAAGLQSRMLGVNFAGATDKTTYDGYQARFDALNPSQGIVGYENYYDAAYYLFYAAAAAGPVSPLIGPDIALGMKRLLAGRPAFEVGPEHLPAAYLALQSPDVSVTINGTMGSPNFDPKTGARFTAGTVWCIDGERLTMPTDVLRLDASGELVGEVPCFAFP